MNHNTYIMVTDNQGKKYPFMLYIKSIESFWNELVSSGSYENDYLRIEYDQNNSGRVDKYVTKFIKHHQEPIN